MKKSFNAFLTEALTNDQKDQMKNWEQPHHSFSDHVFGADNHRVTIPMMDENHAEADKILEPHGYKVKDYYKGLATDKYGRDVKLGKVFEKIKAPDDIKKKLQVNMSRGASNSNDYHVVISRHSHDVAGMSTGTEWTSCMEFDHGINRRYLPEDIKSGTHVAYLTHKDDTDIKTPLARIAIKPFNSTKDPAQKIIRSETRMYGRGSDAFQRTVEDWSQEHFPALPGHIYVKPDNLYHDSDRSFEYSKNDPNIFDTIMSSNSSNVKEHYLRHTKFSDDEFNRHEHDMQKYNHTLGYNKNLTPHQADKVLTNLQYPRESHKSNLVSKLSNDMIVKHLGSGKIEPLDILHNEGYMKTLKPMDVINHPDPRYANIIRHLPLGTNKDVINQVLTHPKLPHDTQYDMFNNYADHVSDATLNHLASNPMNYVSGIDALNDRDKFDAHPAIKTKMIDNILDHQLNAQHQQSIYNTNSILAIIKSKLNNTQVDKAMQIVDKHGSTSKASSLLMDHIHDSTDENEKTNLFSRLSNSPKIASVFSSHDYDYKNMFVHMPEHIKTQALENITSDRNTHTQDYALSQMIESTKNVSDKTREHLLKSTSGIEMMIDHKLITPKIADQIPDALEGNQYNNALGRSATTKLFQSPNITNEHRVKIISQNPITARAAQSINEIHDALAKHSNLSNEDVYNHHSNIISYATDNNILSSDEKDDLRHNFVMQHHAGNINLLDTEHVSSIKDNNKFEHAFNHTKSLDPEISTRIANYAADHNLFDPKDSNNARKKIIFDHATPWSQQTMYMRGQHPQDGLTKILAHDRSEQRINLPQYASSEQDLDQMAKSGHWSPKDIMQTKHASMNIAHKFLSGEYTPNFNSEKTPHNVYKYVMQGLSSSFNGTQEMLDEIEKKYGPTMKNNHTPYSNMK